MQDTDELLTSPPPADMSKLHHCRWINHGYSSSNQNNWRKRWKSKTAIKHIHQEQTQSRAPNCAFYITNVPTTPNTKDDISHPATSTTIHPPPQTHWIYRCPFKGEIILREVHVHASTKINPRWDWCQTEINQSFTKEKKRALKKEIQFVWTSNKNIMLQISKVKNITNWRVKRDAEILNLNI